MIAAVGWHDRAKMKIFCNILSGNMVSRDFEQVELNLDMYNDCMVKPKSSRNLDCESATYANIFDLYVCQLENLSSKELEDAHKLSFQSFVLLFHERDGELVLNAKPWDIRFLIGLFVLGIFVVLQTFPAKASSLLSSD